MKLLSIPLAVGAIATLALLGRQSWQQRQEIERLRASTLSTIERATLQKRVWDAEKRARDLEAQGHAAAKTARESSQEPGEPLADVASASRPERTKGTPSIAQLMTFLNQPETLRALNAKFREQVEIRYAAFFKSLNLDAAQLAQVKDLLLERQAAAVDVAGAALSQGLKPDAEELRQLISSLQAQTDRKLATALGASVYTQFEAFENAQLFRGATTSLQQGLARVSTPLSDEQAEQFATGIATLAQGSFSPAQQQALRQLTQLQQSHQALQQVEQLYRSSLNSSKSPEKKSGE